MVHCLVMEIAKTKKCYVTFVYAYNEEYDRLVE